MTGSATADAVSFAEFARLIGVSRQYVNKLREHDRLVLTEDGKRVLVDPSKKLIKDTAGAPSAVSPPTDPDSDDETAPQTRAYWEKREAAAKAMLREMELERLRGDLVLAADVEAAAMDLGSSLRAALENLPDQLAPSLAAELNEDRVRQILIEQVDAVLAELSTKLQAIAKATT